MNTRTVLWLVPALLYAAFVGWYTDFGGTLTDAEVEEYIDRLAANGADPDMLTLIETFAREDSGRQFLMVNNIDYNENPPTVEGAEPGADAQQLMGRYMEHMFPALLSRGSHPVVMGPTVIGPVDIVGIEGAEQWDTGALFRYRSRRTFLEIVTNPDFSGKHDFKIAALTKTIAYPIEPDLYLGDLRLLLGLFLLAVTALIDNWRMSRAASTLT